MNTVKLLEFANHENIFELGLENIEIDNIPEIPLEGKVGYFKKALKKFNAKLVNDNFLTKIADGDVVEIYMPDMSQVYRSINFFKTCSYKPNFLFARPWYELFYRANSVNKELFVFVTDIMESKKSTTKYPIASHYLKETMGKKNVTKIDLGYATALLKKSSNEVFGFASTLKATNVIDNVTPLIV